MAIAISTETMTVTSTATPTALVKEMEKQKPELESAFGSESIIQCKFQVFKLIIVHWLTYFYFNYRNISKPVDGPPTNNVAEIEAATQAIQTAHSCGTKSKSVIVY